MNDKLIKLIKHIVSNSPIKEYFFVDNHCPFSFYISHISWARINMLHIAAELFTRDSLVWLKQNNCSIYLSPYIHMYNVHTYTYIIFDMKAFMLARNLCLSPARWRRLDFKVSHNACPISCCNVHGPIRQGIWVNPV